MKKSKQTYYDRCFERNLNIKNTWKTQPSSLLFLTPTYPAAVSEL